MTATAESLRQLHRIHRQLADLRGRLRRGPELVRVGEGGVAHAEQEHDRIREEVRAMRMAADEKDLQFKEKEGRIQDLKTKLNGCSTNKEYQALQEQIAAAEMASSVLQDEILESLEKVDDFQGAVAEVKKLCQTGNEKLAQTKADVAKKEVLIQADLTRVEAELIAAEARLPDDFRVEYDRVVKSKHDDAMAQIEGEHCGGCYQSLTPNVVNHLMLAKIVFCQSCGRLLYLPENHSVGS